MLLSSVRVGGGGAGTTRDDFIAFCDAAKHGNVPALRRFEAIGGDVWACSTQGVTALMSAALFRQEASVAWLLHRARPCPPGPGHASTADVNATDQFSATAALYSVAVAPVDNDDDPTCLFLLVEAGIDVNVPDLEGHTPLYLAALNGYQATVQYLVTLPSCDVEARSYPPESVTADAAAVSGRHWGCAQMVWAEVRLVVWFVRARACVCACAWGR